MAYAKTTPGQIIAQIAIGGALGTILWNSLKKDEPKFDLEEEPPKIQIAALDEATRANTSGKFWGLHKQSQSDQQSSTKSPPK